MLDEITPLILTYNEAPNIERTLGRLTWARQIVVIDSGSTDRTLEILARHPNVRTVQHRFDDYSSQWNFGLDQVKTPWILSLDSDYVLGQSIVAELRTLNPPEEVAAYTARFRYVVFGKPLRGSLYPDRAVLFRRDASRYVKDGHRQRLQTEGLVSSLNGSIDHDDRKSLERWLNSQLVYARVEAEHLLAENPKTLAWADRLRRLIWPAVPAVFVYTLFVKGCILDGWPGLFYALQRTYAELLLSLQLLEKKLNNDWVAGVGAESSERSPQ